MSTISNVQRTGAGLVVLCGALVLGAASAHAAPLFPALSFDVAGAAPRALAIGDLNADGKPDFVTANASSNSISVLTGNGDGTFGAPTTFATGTQPYDVTLADVNNDGKLDAVTANHGANTVSILLGNGLGSFGAKTDVITGTQPRAVQVANVNGDLHKDLLVANYGDYTFSVLLRKPDGSYFPKVDYPCTVNPLAIALGDVNNDGKLDAAVAGENTTDCGVLLGNGNGTFQYPIIVGTGGPQAGIALADLNADNKLDLVTTNPHELQTNASVRLGNGNGTFGAIASYPTGSSPSSVQVLDVTGDGNPDIVIADFGENQVSVLSGIGNGTFAPRQDFASGNNPLMARVADLNGDGRLDIAAVDHGLARISVLLGFGDGLFGRQLHWTFSMYDLAVTSIDGNVSPDVVTFEQECFNTCPTRIVSVYRGNGDGFFGAGARFSVANPGHNAYQRATGLAVGDFNGDGHVDAVASNSSVDLITMLGNGDGTLGTQIPTAVNGHSTYPMRAGDFDRDGKLDLVAASRVWLGDGDGTFTEGTMLPMGGWTTVARVDVDDNLDLLAVTESNQVAIAIGNGDGTFDAPSYYTVGTTPQRVAVGDVNEDGKPDLVVTNGGSASISVLLGFGDGTFAPAVHYPTSASPLPLALSDLDGDGHLDVAVVGLMVSVLRGLGDGTFGAPSEYAPFGPSSHTIVARDLDGDHRPELIIGQLNYLTVLRNIGTGTVTGVEPFVAPSLALTIAPNPAYTRAELSFSLPSEELGTVEVLDVSGRRIARVFEGRLSPGLHSMRWDGTTLNGRPARHGIYLVRMKFGRMTATRRLAWLGI